jgi:hypothetical protein
VLSLVDDCKICLKIKIVVNKVELSVSMQEEGINSFKQISFI